MKSYEVAEHVAAERWVNGERVSFEADAGTVTPKNEGEETILDELVELRPDVVKVAAAKKSAATSKRARS